MKFIETKLKGVFIIELERLEDERGFFARAFCRKEFESHGLSPDIVQSNISFNKTRGTLRGMHFQLKPHEEVKMVRCTRGAVFDVVIDLRKDSPTHKQWVSVELTEDNYKMLYIPEGLAHGYLTLKDRSDLLYSASRSYAPGFEGGVRYDDPAFGIEWPKDVAVARILDRDKKWADYKT